MVTRSASDEAESAGLAFAHAKVAPLAPDDPRHAEINGWLAGRMKASMTFFDKDAPPRASKNNLRAWAALAAARMGASTPRALAHVPCLGARARVSRHSMIADPTAAIFFALAGLVSFALVGAARLLARRAGPPKPEEGTPDREGAPLRQPVNRASAPARD